MFYEPGCYGRVALGELPHETRRRLSELPGEWLEFDPAASAIVVRHCQPSAGPCLPTIAGELLRMLGEVIHAERAAIPGGELYVHTEEKGQLVRLRVEQGGDLRISWAHPDYARARRADFSGRENLPEPHVQRLDGQVSLVTNFASEAAQQLQALADAYEGLYPEGEFTATPGENDTRVRIEMRGVNLDVLLLVKHLQQIAVAGTLRGHIDVTSFAAEDPEQFARFVFEEGKIWIERPVLWEERVPDPQAFASAAQ